jgi:lysylphosphatidylglycerol synthetase-like protein (DUF2156 family)
VIQNKSTDEQKRNERPFGVSLIAVVVMLVGAVTVVLGLLGMLLGFVTGIMDASRGSGFAFLAGVAGVVLGAVYVLAGIGLWNLRAWAWWLAVLAGVVGFVLALGSPFWMVTWALVVAYLFVVRAHFGTLPNVPRLVNA